jgi:DNA-binding transcriptional LysR family regulator
MSCLFKLMVLCFCHIDGPVHLDNLSMPAMHPCMERSGIPGLPEADWRLIRAFVAVMRTGTLTQAAAQIGATQPTLGRQIRELERRAGEPFFLRRGKRLEPTDRARHLYDQACDIEVAVTGLARAFAAPANDTRTSVRITTSVIFATVLLPKLLQSMLPALPGIDFEIAASDSIENLLRRDADIAIRFVRPTQGQLIASRVTDVDIALYASKGYVAEHGLPHSITDLLQHSFVGNQTGADIRGGAAALGLDPAAIRIVLRSDNSKVRHAALREGMGIGAAFRLLGDREPDLVRVLPEVTVGTLPVWLVAHDDLRRSDALRRVYDALRLRLSDALCGRAPDTGG